MTGVTGQSQAARSPAPARARLDERTEYVPRGATEQFIVPLLREAIEARLRPGSATMSTIKAGEPVLDVGCGRQPFRRLLEQSGVRYVGLDTQQNENCPVEIVAAIDDEQAEQVYERGPYGLIVCTEVLEHVGNWDAAFANMARALRPGGRLVITCPFVFPIHEAPYDFWRPTVFALEQFASKHGLGVVESLRLGTGWDVLGTVLTTVTPRERGGAWSRMCVIGFKLVRRAILWLMLRGAAQRWLELGGDIYQSNLIVLEKPA